MSIEILITNRVGISQSRELNMLNEDMDPGVALT